LVGAPGENKKSIGLILSLEGADSLITLDHLHRAYEYGLRAIGPAHYGPGRYANGTDATGKMNKNGLDLLKEMEKLNIILDATHLCDDAFWQAMDHFHGNVWASHNNCRALVNHNRQFSDEQIKVLIERDAVIGGAFDAWMLVPNWIRKKSTPREMNCDLEKLSITSITFASLLAILIMWLSVPTLTEHLGRSNVLMILKRSLISKKISGTSKEKRLRR
jgi:membrane dipeptidase